VQRHEPVARLLLEVDAEKEVKDSDDRTPTAVKLERKVT
jgi:hypothetical protein